MPTTSTISDRVASLIVERSKTQPRPTMGPPVSSSASMRTCAISPLSSLPVSSAEPLLRSVREKLKEVRTGAAVGSQY